MIIKTRFDIGDPVEVKRSRKRISFRVGQIRIQTLPRDLLLIEYRARYATGRNGTWFSEGELELSTGGRKLSTLIYRQVSQIEGDGFPKAEGYEMRTEAVKNGR
jgi:hypothetical protein